MPDQNHKEKMMQYFKIFLLAVSLTTLTSCSALYYGTMEKVGRHKREILVDRVESANKSQVKAQEEFQTALEKFKSVVDFDGGDLERKYNELNKKYQRCNNRADDIRKRINSIEDVGNALFKEWKKELDQYSNQKLRLKSDLSLRRTRAQFNKLVQAMREVEQRMQPVLTVFHDHVLFLKHNLNAQAIASLDIELDSIQKDVNGLIQEMQNAISEAQKFIQSMEKQG